MLFDKDLYGFYKGKRKPTVYATTKHVLTCSTFKVILRNSCVNRNYGRKLMPHKGSIYEEKMSNLFVLSLESFLPLAEYEKTVRKDLFWLTFSP